jgi:hypothetical protein
MADAALHYYVAEIKVLLLAACAQDKGLGINNLRFEALLLTLFVKRLFFKANFVINDRNFYHY